MTDLDTRGLLDTSVLIDLDRMVRTFDALIAATAIRYNLPLYTRNVGDFQGIVGVGLHQVT